ncbi:hypothetical protein FKG94_25420 [Exilibacterium tricleocarpae]|uniref:Outer membrane protein assembly factor BamE n=1 Tax=Exilibacterium tricleocarpae TaxID=2591008 RepID=A0A545SRW9_9GAMM|nr:hypothetical protein [Exilibacterium tricleocarpae]TQV67709.1 hypothetical protein FKG94_25420 [Exilibacterium tricleocarpae]
MRVFALLIAILFVAACATTEGRKFDVELAKSFKKGESTLTEVIAKMGEPQARTQLPNGGGERIQYLWSETTNNQLGRLPGVASNLEKSKNKTEIFYFTFNSEGVLTDTIYTSSNK